MAQQSLYETIFEFIRSRVLFWSAPLISISQLNTSGSFFIKIHELFSEKSMEIYKNPVSLNVKERKCPGSAPWSGFAPKCNGLFPALYPSTKFSHVENIISLVEGNNGVYLQHKLSVACEVMKCTHMFPLTGDPGQLQQRHPSDLLQRAHHSITMMSPKGWGISCCQQTNVACTSFW